MTQEAYEKAQDLKAKIEHLKNVIAFLTATMDSKRLNIRMTESGFVSHPKEEIMRADEISFVLKAYKIEKERLEQEFRRL